MKLDAPETCSVPVSSLSPRLSFLSYSPLQPALLLPSALLSNTMDFFFLNKNLFLSDLFFFINSLVPVGCLDGPLIGTHR